MIITFDPAKRDATLVERKLDFARAADVFAGATFDRDDLRRDYGERRVITIGRLVDRMVVIVWTPRGDDRHVISMRKANDRERRRFEIHLG